jgi:hypothetical protein
MTAEDLLTDLQRQGFTLIPLPEGKLAVKPSNRLTEELRQRLRKQKAELLSLLCPRPYLTDKGELRIPFESDPHYHWWKPGGQSIALTLQELNAPADVWRRYVGQYTETRQ